MLGLADMVVVELHARVQRGGFEGSRTGIQLRLGLRGKKRDTFAGFLWGRGKFLGNVNNMQGFIR